MLGASFQRGSLVKLKPRFSKFRFCSLQSIEALSCNIAGVAQSMAALYCYVSISGSEESSALSMHIGFSHTYSVRGVVL